MKTKAFIFLLFMVLFLTVTGCAGNDSRSSSDENKHVTLVYTFKSGSLDPHNGAIPLRAGITETLVKLNENLEIEGWLSKDWKAVDERTWEFTIRDDVTFHNGQKLDAAAVKASFERGIDVSQSLANALKIESMTTDGQILTIKTTEPYPALVSELVNPLASVVNAEAEQEMGQEAFNLAPIGTGPFKVKQFTPNIEILLERHEAYWAGTPKLHSAKFQFNEDANVRALALQTQEADIVYNLPAESIEVIEKHDALHMESVSGLRAHFILFNQNQPLMQDLKVRKAIDLLMNRESVAQDIMLGNAAPANGPFNSKLPFGSKDSVAAQDLQQAKALLEEAGFQAGKDGKLIYEGEALTLQMITYQGRPELPLMAQLLQSDARNIGVNFDIKTVESVDSYLVENSDWHIATYSSLTAPRGDGGFFLNTAYTPEGSMNLGKINNVQLNEKIALLNATSDVDKRIELTQESVTLINQEMLHSFGVYPNIIVGMNKRVIGWKPGAEEYYMLTHTMDVE